MLILWKANFDGDRDELQTVDHKIKDLSKDQGYTIDGPYYPQDASLLYLIHGSIEQMNESGRQLLPWLEEEDIDLTPLEYEVAVTPDEFWGPA